MSTLQMQWYIYALQEIEFAMFLAGAPNLKYARWKVFLVVFAGEILAALPFIRIWDMPWVMPIRGVLFFLCYFLAIWLMFSDTRQRKLELLLYLLIAMIFADILSAVMAVGVQMLRDAAVAERVVASVFVEGSETKLYGAVLFNINFMGLGSIFLAFYQRIERSVRGRMIWMLLLLTASQDALLAGMMFFCSDALKEYFLFYTAGTILLSVTALYFVYRTLDGAVEAMDSKRELEQLKLRQDMDYRYYQLAQASAAQMSAFRHDFRNQLQVAYAVAERDPARAVRLLGELEEHLDQTRQISYCENPIVNALLAIKSEEARTAGFEMEIRASVGQWRLSETELTSLFANLLDNAIEGSRRSGQTGGTIAVQAAQQKGFYLVQVENPCAPDALHAGKTSKADRENHGLGLDILRKIARQHHGSLETRVENGRFIALMTLESERGEG
ncbi:MAG: sensor histidine kinase [Candidatus Onthomonas sp.]